MLTLGSDIAPDAGGILAALGAAASYAAYTVFGARLARDGYDSSAVMAAPFAIAAVYPDARFVLTHRDPVNVIASVCSLVRSLAGTFTDTDWQNYIRETWPEFVGSLLDNQNAFRDAQITAGRGDSFVDIAYSDLVGDPITTIASLYEQLGENFSAEAESAMRAHSAEHKKDRFGSHSYSLEEWGLDRDALTERVQPYLTRYAEYLE